MLWNGLTESYGSYVCSASISFREMDETFTMGIFELEFETAMISVGIVIQDNYELVNVQAVKATSL